MQFAFDYVFECTLCNNSVTYRCVCSIMYMCIYV